MEEREVIFWKEEIKVISTRYEICSNDWRWLIGVLILSYTFLICGASIGLEISGRQVLQGLGVAALDHPLMDLRGVAAWCDAWEKGNNPAVVETTITIAGESKGYPNFLMNYSPVVFMFGKLGLSTNSVFIWGIALFLIYAIALWALCGPCTSQQAFLWALLICSPASVLLVERGNLDMLIFALLVSALMLRKNAVFESGIILTASLLKFYPILALVAPWLKQRGKGHLIVYMAALIFTLFLVMIRSRLATISGSLEGQSHSAFGYSVMADLLSHSGVLTKGQGFHLVITGSRIIAFLGILASLLLGFRAWGTIDRSLLSERASHAFFLGVPLLLVLFVQGVQMDYKWVFFLLMVPASMELARSQLSVEALSAKMWFYTISAYSYWTFFSDEGSLRNALLKQLLMWVAVFLSAFLAGRVWYRRGILT